MIVCLGAVGPIAALLNPIIYFFSDFAFSYDQACRSYLAGVTPALWQRFFGGAALSVVPPCFMANLHWAVILQTALVLLVSLAGLRLLKVNPVAFGKQVKLAVGFGAVTGLLYLDFFGFGFAAELIIIARQLGHPNLAPISPLTWSVMMACYMLLFSIVSLPTLILPAACLRRLWFTAKPEP